MQVKSKCMFQIKQLFSFFLVHKDTNAQAIIYFTVLFQDHDITGYIKFAPFIVSF